MMTAHDIALDFWHRNSAGSLVDILTDGEIITTFGPWTLPDILALMNPCGDLCRSFLGNGHVAACSEPFEEDGILEGDDFA